MDVPVLIITYKRVDFVLEILHQLMRKNLKKVYLSVDDYYNNREFSRVETYLECHGFQYRVLKWQGNVGCDENVMQGINWFFKQEEQGLILEDDCIPVAGFDRFLSALAALDLDGSPVSFFSTNTAAAVPLRIYPSLLPIYWGWYSTKEFFSGFYKFYTNPPAATSIARQLWRKGISDKIKLVAMINYLAHRIGKKGIAWDSELLAYLIWSKKHFWVPSVSFIDNKGFGELSSTHTHTASIPVWYNSINRLHADINLGDVTLQGIAPAPDKQFLETFFANYSSKKIKLMGTLLKTYLQFTLSRKRDR